MQDPLNNVGWGSWITGFCVGDTPDQLAALKEQISKMQAKDVDAEETAEEEEEAEEVEEAKEEYEDDPQE